MALSCCTVVAAPSLCTHPAAPASPSTSTIRNSRDTSVSKYHATYFSDLDSIFPRVKSSPYSTSLIWRPNTVIVLPMYSKCARSSSYLVRFRNCLRFLMSTYEKHRGHRYTFEPRSAVRWHSVVMCSPCTRYTRPLAWWSRGVPQCAGAPPTNVQRGTICSPSPLPLCPGSRRTGTSIVPRTQGPATLTQS